MDINYVQTLPVKYLKPIFLAPGQPLPDFASLQVTSEATTTTDFQMPATTTTTSTVNFTESYAQPTVSTTQSTFGAAGVSGAKIVRRGSGITINEQNQIVSVAQEILQGGITPVSNNTARGVKKKLGGDWLVIVYPDGKAIDFNMTCVQGNDYLYFILSGTAFQVCRLK